MAVILSITATNSAIQAPLSRQALLETIRPASAAHAGPFQRSIVLRLRRLAAWVALRSRPEMPRRLPMTNHHIW